MKRQSESAVQAEAAGYVDEVIALIEPESVDRIDEVRDQSLSCRGTDLDPDGKVRAWQNRQFVWLLDGIDIQATLAEIVSAQVSAGWEVVSDIDRAGDGSRQVQMVVAGDDADRFTLTIDIGPQLPEQNFLNVRADSPCFEIS